MIFAPDFTSKQFFFGGGGGGDSRKFASILTFNPQRIAFSLKKEPFFFRIFLVAHVYNTKYLSGPPRLVCRYFM